MPRHGDHAHAGHDENNHAVGIDSVEHLVEHLGEVVRDSTVLVCIGNDICGDDGAGPAVAERLAGAVPWYIVNAQSVPESFLMKIVDRKPETVVLIDALAFEAPVGTIELFQTGDLTGQSPSTHGPAPLSFLEVLQMMHPCRAAVLGIQPKQVEFGTGICAEVQNAVETVVQAFRKLAEITKKNT